MIDLVWPAQSTRAPQLVNIYEIVGRGRERGAGIRRRDILQQIIRICVDSASWNNCVWEYTRTRRIATGQVIGFPGRDRVTQLLRKETRPITSTHGASKLTT